jgi:hypothetical protein
MSATDAFSSNVSVDLASQLSFSVSSHLFSESAKLRKSHVMLQSRRSSHFEALIARNYPYIGREVENEIPKTQIFCEENLWSRYDA